MAKSKYASLEQRLALNSAIDQKSGCVIWKGYTQKDGYISNGTGYGRINLTRDKRSLKFPTHRVSKVNREMTQLEPGFDFYDPEHKAKFFALYEAYSLCRLTIDHLCGHSLCINPDHLEWVYMSPNIWRKKWKEGRRNKRITAVSCRATRHDKMLQSSDSVQEFVRKIRAKSYRKKT